MQMIMIGGTEAEAELKKLVAYATLPDNYYVPKIGQPPPQPDQNLIKEIRVKNGFDGSFLRFQIIFTITKSEFVSGDASIVEPLFRHATISCEQGKVVPDEIACFTICKFLGFTGPLESWIISGYPPMPNAVAILQNFPAEPAHPQV